MSSKQGGCRISHFEEKSEGKVGLGPMGLDLLGNFK